MCWGSGPRSTQPRAGLPVVQRSLRKHRPGRSGRPGLPSPLRPTRWWTSESAKPEQLRSGSTSPHRLQLGWTASDRPMRLLGRSQQLPKPPVLGRPDPRVRQAYDVAAWAGRIPVGLWARSAPSAAAARPAIRGWWGWRCRLWRHRVQRLRRGPGHRGPGHREQRCRRARAAQRAVRPSRWMTRSGWALVRRRHCW